jgi:hypothetical protein
MRRSLILFLLAAILLPSFCYAQKTDPVPTDVKSETRRKEEEEAMRRAKAEAEAMRKKQEADAAKKKATLEEYKKAAEKLKTESKSQAGFQLLKIPVTGVYYLGMRQREYDSLVNQNPLSVTTDQKRYDLQQAPYYYKGRLYMLSLSLPDSIFSSDMPDITSYYKNKLGTPDEEKISDSVMVFPSDEDSSLQGAYRVKQATIAWHYNHHDIVIRYRFTDMKNGVWKGFYMIRYNGTIEYVKNLGRLAEKD